MNYYIFPKNNSKLQISFLFDTDNKDTIFISHTMVNALTCMNNHIKKYENHHVKEISKKINPYEFIFSNVTDTTMPISKINPHTNIFYELYEIILSYSLFDNVEMLKEISILHIGDNSLSVNLLIDTIRNTEFDNKTFLNFKSLDKNKIENIDIIDIGFFECNPNINGNQNNNLIVILLIICLKMNKNGTVIIKLNEITNKATIDILYILNNLFEKNILTKPLLSNILNSESFLICNNFIGKNRMQILKEIENVALKIINNAMDVSIISVLKNKIPTLFLTKIEEYNAIFGQQQLESKDQLINIINNKNKYDKIESLKRTNIQKGIMWCEKYNIPHNNFTEKNIFLNIKPMSNIVENEHDNQNNMEFAIDADNC